MKYFVIKMHYIESKWKQLVATSLNADSKSYDLVMDEVNPQKFQRKGELIATHPIPPHSYP